MIMAMSVEERKASKKARSKVYYEANKDKVKARVKLYYEANKDKVKAKDKAYKDANKDKIKARSAAYYKENKDKIKPKAALRQKLQIRNLADWYIRQNVKRHSSLKSVDVTSELLEAQLLLMLIKREVRKETKV